MMAPCQELESPREFSTQKDLKVSPFEQQLAVVKEKMEDCSCTIVYGRIMGFSSSKVELRDWLHANLLLEGSSISEAILMVCGIFLLKFPKDALTFGVIRDPHGVGMAWINLNRPDRDPFR